MRAEVIHPRELGPEQVARWRRLQEPTPQLSSPFLGPSFAQLVGSVREDARVAVLPDDGGFFAFHRGPGGTGSPLGRTLADYQALVAAPGLEWTPRGLVRACGLRSYAFDHMIVAQEPWTPFIRVRESSPIVDLTRFDPETGIPSKVATQARQLGRKADLRFVWHDADPAALATLVGWKRGQYARSGVHDIFGHDWVPGFVQRLSTSAQPDLAGVLACLYDGDDLLAAHLMLQSGTVLHSWMPAYDPARGKGSPGTVLMREILLEAHSRGMTCLDFGKGVDSYKLRFANGEIEVGAGSVESRAAWGLAARTYRSIHDLANRTRLQGRMYRSQRRSQVG